MSTQPADRIDEVVKFRLTFLNALRWDQPLFWRSLHDEVWCSGGPDILPWWLLTHGVVDDWFKMVIVDTITYWTLTPDSPNARLEAGYRWFYYRAADEPVPVHEFRPTWEHPYLLMRRAPADVERRLLEAGPEERERLMAAIDKESPKELERRIRDQFESQLKPFMAEVRRLWGELPAETIKHAEWTVLRFVGVSRRDIVRRWPGMLNYSDPEQAVSRAVNRFAERIGLTLPAKCYL